MQVSERIFQQDDADAISPVKRALMLKTFPAFTGLEPSSLALLASICKERYFKKGSVMLKPGVPVLRFYLIVEGSVQMYKGGIATKEFGPRSAIGGLAALTRDPEGAHTVAVEDVLALEMDRDDMQDVFEDSFSVLLGVLSALALTLRDMQRQMGGSAAIAASRKLKAIKADQKLSLVERMFFLRRTTNFGDARIEALADIALEAEQVHYAKGEQLWKTDEPADYSIMVLNGVVECRPEEANNFAFGAGYVVGDLDALAWEPRWYSAYAKEEVDALVLKRSSTFDVLEDNTDMAMQLLRNFASGITAFIAKMTAMKRALDPEED